SASWDCMQCPAGSIAPDQGSVSCTECLPGDYSTMGGTQCLQCPANTYSVGDRCASCGAGLVSPAGSASSTDCQNLAASYAAGFLLLIVGTVVVLLHICRG